MTFGLRLFEMRQNTGMSLQQLADTVGVSKAYLWELEKGRSANPSFELVARLATHFGVAPEVLMGTADTPSRAEQQIERIHRDLKVLSERDRELIETMVKTMRQKTAEAKP